METILIIIIIILGIAVICCLSFFESYIFEDISSAINAEDKSKEKNEEKTEPEPSNNRNKKKKKETTVASAPNEIFLDDAQKACEFLQSHGISSNIRRTRFFRVCIDGKFQPSWLSKDVSGEYYTFGAKGENLQCHKSEPSCDEYCHRNAIILYGKRYNVFNDKFIVPI